MLLMGSNERRYNGLDIWRKTRMLYRFVVRKALGKEPL
jgi:hypothetical protein